MLCGKSILSHRDPDNTSHYRTGQTLQIKPTTVELELEDRTCISLTIIDTPGFGDEIDNETSFSTIVGYLEQQHDNFLAEESRIKRNPHFRDHRVHAMLYFITPTGHGLRELDIELMKCLAPCVNVIPVIGRADSLTPIELSEYKERIMEDIEYYRIPVYSFPDIEEDDEETIEENALLRRMMPFAIVSSEEVFEIGDRKVRARRYPWGMVEVDNPRHSDFLALRSALLHSHLVDLKEITFDLLYENYRTTKLSRAIDSGGQEYIGDATSDQYDVSAQSIRLQEERLRKEEEKFREVELRLQRDIEEKRQELLVREAQLRDIEARICQQAATSTTRQDDASMI